ncbi:MAG: LamG domain-containing protein, partial [Candidatus Gracilibacteria bacterium]|nr:LamG domain-containing protein [Candidatus Gracilibacteria bacterium]
LSASGTTVEEIVTNNELVYNGYKNLPYQYNGNYKTKGETALNIVNAGNILVYSGDVTILSESSSTGTLARKTMLENLQTAYSGSTISSIGEISQLLNTDTNDATQTEYITTYLVKNDLGGSVKVTSPGNTNNNNTGTGTFQLSQSSVSVGTNVTITDDCSVAPTSYTSSNNSVATVSGSTITTLSTGTINITPVGGSCSDVNSKSLTVVIGGNDTYTKLLLENEFDSSESQHTGTFNGNISITNASKKYGSSSYSFDGASDYISLPTSTDFDFGSGDFTIDGWFKVPNVTGYKTIFASQSDFEIGMFLVGNKMGYFASSNGTSWNMLLGDTGGQNAQGTISITPNVRHHFAYVRNGSNWYGFIDGQLDISKTGINGTIVQKNEVFNIGRWGNASYWYNGEIDEFRVSKGIARWTSDFSSSLPTSHTPDSYTKLLLHGEGDIGNGNIHNLSFNGNIANYSSIGKFNGSYNFDGNGDYITIPNDSDFQLGSNDFTIDFWVNPANFSSEQGIINKEGEWWFGINTDSKFHAWFTYGTPMWNIKLDSTNTFTANQWYHIAVVRNGSNMKLYVNGVEEDSSAVSGGSIDYIGACANKWSIGAGCNGVVFLNGKVDELRVSKGIARWTTNFTPPTEPYSN